MICVSLQPRTAAEALAGLAEAKASGAHLAEIRADSLDDPVELLEILPNKPLPVIATVRPHWEGGRWQGDEESRVRLLSAACLAGADYVDVEFKAYHDFARGNAKLILSYHDFAGVPAKLETIAGKMKGLEPFLVKVAVTARGTADLVRCVRLQKSIGVPSAVIAMGEFGEPLRRLYVRYGGFLTYAAPRSGLETAPGQVPVAELGGVDDATEVYAVVGDPVAHSRSPALFTAAFRGRNAAYVRIRLDEAALFRELALEMELSGASVTIPHKETVPVDERDEVAREVGAVNTVVARGGRLLGANTDAPAALEVLGDVRGKRALLLGAGGVARAVAWALRKGGATLAVANRTRARAEALGAEVVAWEDRARAGADVVVNATSVGMGTDESPFPADAWRAGMRAFDTVYTPRDTRFLRDARAAGAETADGVALFLAQAKRQFRLFTGADMPAEALRDFEREATGLRP